MDLEAILQNLLNDLAASRTTVQAVTDWISEHYIPVPPLDLPPPPDIPDIDPDTL